MKTPLLKRRLNPFLIIITVLVLSLLAGLSVMYQEQLNNVVTTNEGLEADLEQKSEDLDALREERNVLEEKLSERDSDLEDLTREVDDLDAEISRLNAEIESLESEKSRIREENENLTDIESDFESINLTLSDICLNENNTIESGTALCGEQGHSYEGE